MMTVQCYRRDYFVFVFRCQSNQSIDADAGHLIHPYHSLILILTAKLVVAYNESLCNFVKIKFLCWGEWKCEEKCIIVFVR